MAECVEFLASSSVYREGAAPASATNPTLLQPGSRKWLVHYAALPFLGYFPLEPAKHPGIAASQGPRALTQACLSELAALVRGWKACLAAQRVRWRLQWRDALALCADLQQGAGGDSGGDGSSGFDVVDTSNLSDHVGLLNLLALAGPLLRRTVHAR